VFDYNGLGRVDSPLATAATANPGLAGALSAFTVRHGPSWDRLLVGAAGHDIAWLLPAAVLAALGILVARRRRPRSDPLLAAAVLWGLWLLTLLLGFSITGQLNPYYLAALSPAIAALCAVGVTEVWRAGTKTALIALGVVSLATTVYAVALLPGHDAPGWLPVVTTVLGGAALSAAAVAAARPGRATATTALAAVIVAGALVPVVASVTLVADQRGPFDTPFQPPAVTAATQGLAGAAQHLPPATVQTFKQTVMLFRYPLAAYTSLLAAPLIYATGDEVLPIGGFRGTNPSPSLGRLKKLIRQDELRLFLAAPAPDPRIRWVRANCQALPVAGPLPVYSCGHG
jgi:4-amino-4-deoxy-L-arabinose transferase-like glycosyltransferase